MRLFNKLVLLLFVSIFIGCQVEEQDAIEQEYDSEINKLLSSNSQPAKEEAYKAFKNIENFEDVDKLYRKVHREGIAGKKYKSLNFDLINSLFLYGLLKKDSETQFYYAEELLKIDSKLIRLDSYQLLLDSLSEIKNTDKERIRQLAQDFHDEALFKAKNTEFHGDSDGKQYMLNRIDNFKQHFDLN